MNPEKTPGALVHGVYAALITPRDDREQVDPAGLERLIEFVLASGVDGLCLGGGTAEYPHFDLDQRKEIVSIAAACLDHRVPFLASVGAPTLRGVLELAEHALMHGCRALLLPMPYFYRYGQDDLVAYVKEVVRSLEAPCLLYNLADFTNPITPDTSLKLLREEPHVVGLKDSSGDREAIFSLATGVADDRGTDAVSLLCGSDARAFDALEAGWNGIVSGIASCCPELLVSLFRHHRAGRSDEARQCQRLLDALVQSVGRLPVPWSIRVAADVRGVPSGPFPLPLAEERREEMARLRAFYGEWFARHLPSLP